MNGTKKRLIKWVNEWNSQVSCLQDNLVHWCHKAWASNQPIFELIHCPLHEMETITNTSWVTEILKLDSPVTYGKPNSTVLLKRSVSTLEGNRSATYSGQWVLQKQGLAGRQAGGRADLAS